MGLDMYFYIGKELSIDEVSDYNRFTQLVNKYYRELPIRDGNLNKASEIALEKAREKMLVDVKNFDEIVDTMENLRDVAYFRKHSDLHGYLGDKFLYPREGDDNCIYISLEKEDVCDIVKLAKNNLRGETSKKYQGFFWGESDREDWEETISEMEKILELLGDGEMVYYYAWY